MGRHDARKGLPILLEAWPAIHQATGARLRIMGTDPLQYRLLHSRLRVDEKGVDVLGIVTNEVRTHELARAKVSVTPALGGESFGLVLAEAYACATPAVASDIPGYAAVATPETAVLVPPGDPDALAIAVCELLEDEERRQRLGVAARQLVRERYGWDEIAARLERVYELVTGVRSEPAAGAPRGSRSASRAAGGAPCSCCRSRSASARSCGGAAPSGTSSATRSPPSPGAG